MSDNSTEAWMGLLLALGSLAIVTCSGGGSARPAEAAHEAGEPVEVAPSEAREAAEPELAGGSAEAPARPLPLAAPEGGAERHSGPLAAFWKSADALIAGQRRDHLRVLWFGDSHTAADFWVHPVRRLLSDTIGAGGPGYVQVGLSAYRHGAARIESDGKWRIQPAAPSGFVKQQGDGRYGLSGVRAVPKDERAWASVRPARGSLKGKARWQVIFRLPEAGSRFTLSLDSGATQIVSAGVGTAHPSGVSSIDLESDAEATLRIGQAVLEPEIFAVVVEGSEPGLVLDTLGINGARVATSLTWDEAHFTGELQRRKPDLVVLAYGTNEVGDALAPFRYADHYEALLARVRAAAPGASCLLLGPTDRALPDWSSNPRSVEIEQVQREVAARAGCGFFSMLAAMGGPGSLQRWAFASPTLARKDRVHLTIDGYTQLGEALAQHLLQQWRGPQRGAASPH